MMDGHGQDWEGRLHPTPTAAQIRALADSHGWDAVEERYWWLTRRALDYILQRDRERQCKQSEANAA